MKELNFIVWLSADWDKFHRKSSLLPFTKYGKVLLVQRTADIPVSSLFFRERIKDIVTKKSLCMLSKNLFLFRPFAIVHETISENIPFATRLNRIILKIQFSRTIKTLNLHSAPLVLIIYTPFHSNYTNLFDESVIIYECYDEYSEAQSFSMSKKQKIRELESKLIKKSDIIITTSKQLYDLKKEKSMCTYFLPNGVDYGFFSNIHSENVKISKLVENIQHPIIGFLGDLNDARDINLLNWISSKRVDWSFVFIGQDKLTSKNDRYYLEKMKKQKNVHLMGWLPDDELLGVCKAFDVGLIPSKVDNTFAQYMFPNKLFEYMAMGIPVVSTNMPELRPFEKIIKISITKENFEENIEKSLKGNSPEKINQMLQLAKENSWIKRSDKIVDIISTLI